MPDLARRRIAVLCALCAACAALVACSSFDSASNRIASVITPYRMDVVQGNVVTREQVALLKPGMSRPQVRDIMGTALLMSVFHADRWDYVFTLQRQKVDPQARRVSVFFKDNVMERVESEQLPSEAEFVSTLSANAPPKVTPVLEASPEALAAFPVARKPAPTGAVVGAPASYPPLEPAATK